MNPCQRCGANNDASSRFCAACGAPVGGRTSGEQRQVRPDTSPPAGPLPQSPTAAPIPWPPPQTSSHAVVNPNDGGPPSASLPFAETAGPATTGEVFDKRRAAVAAVAAVERALSQRPPAASAFASTAASAGTAAMPGVAQEPELVPEGAPRILAGFFISYDIQPLGRVWPIFQGRSRLGRQGAGPDIDIEIEHPTASTRHAIVYASALPGRVKIEDTGSTNGTMVNGSRLAVGARHELRDGDRIRFGLLSAIVKII